MQRVSIFHEWTPSSMIKLAASAGAHATAVISDAVPLHEGQENVIQVVD